MILFLDTTDFNRVAFAIINQKITRKTYKINPHESHKTLQKLKEFLDKSKIQTSNIKKIIVNSGPGSYTGVRIGITAAQALGFAWKIPVFAVEKSRVPENLLDLVNIKNLKKP